MENLIFSLNATMPIFLLMVLGAFLHEIHCIDDVLAAKMNRFVFQIPLPVLVFKDLATVDFSKVWDLRFLVFCFTATFLSIVLSALISLVWKDKSIRGEFVQASYRSSAAILGIAFIQNIYGSSGMAPLMFIGSVPLYNIMAVVVLTLLKPGNHGIDSALMNKTVKGIFTNPIIIAIVLGLFWSILKIPMPAILSKSVSKVASIATPMGLMAMGASFDRKKAGKKLVPAATASFIKLIGLCCIFLPIAVALGFRQEELTAILVMLGSATTVSCFVMAKNMGHEGTLTSSVVMLTTMFSGFSLTFWLWLVKTLGLI